MTTQRRAAYLEAMGIPVWQERGIPVSQLAAANDKVRQLLVVMCSHSDSPWLWVIADANRENNHLLADIRRAVGDRGDGNICYSATAGGRPLDVIVHEHLVTRIVLFGQELDPRDLVRQKSCDIVEAPSLEALAGSADMKKQLWNNLRQLLDYRQV